MSTETSTQTDSHEFSTSGCRYQWRADHDHAACYDALIAFNGGWK
jgi:hypothetical protein